MLSVEEFVPLSSYDLFFLQAFNYIYQSWELLTDGKIIFNRQNSKSWVYS